MGNGSHWAREHLKSFRWLERQEDKKFSSRMRADARRYVGEARLARRPKRSVVPNGNEIRGCPRGSACIRGKKFGLAASWQQTDGKPTRVGYPRTGSRTTQGGATACLGSRLTGVSSAGTSRRATPIRLSAIP
jgi:hypothetical protein